MIVKVTTSLRLEEGLLRLDCCPVMTELIVAASASVEVLDDDQDDDHDDDQDDDHDDVDEDAQVPVCEDSVVAEKVGASVSGGGIKPLVGGCVGVATGAGAGTGAGTGDTGVGAGRSLSVSSPSLSPAPPPPLP